MKKKTAVVFAIFVLSLLIFGIAYAGRTETKRLNVGDTAYLYAGSPSNGGAAYAWAWQTSNYNVIRIVGNTGDPSCQIEVVGYASSSPVVVQCIIYTQSYIGSRMVLGQDY